GVTAEGNFVDPHDPTPGLNVLCDAGDSRRPDEATRARIRERLLERRASRVRPGLDSKRLAAWNALMVSALAEVASTLAAVPPDALLTAGGGAEPGQPPARGETSLAGAEAPALVAERLLDAASRCADFVLTRMRDAEGRLLRTFDGGEAKLLAYLEDHGFLLEALLSLYEASGQERWLSAARELAAETIDRFADQERGGFFSTAIDGEALLTRRKDIDDSPIPSGASSVALALLRLHALTGEREYERHATETLALVQELAPRHPSAFGHALQAMRLLATPPLEIAIVGPNGPARDALERAVRSRLLPNAVLAVGDGASKTSVPLLEGRVALDGAPAAYVCRNFACERPVTEPGELSELLDAASPRP
ncbi:MAG: YyaL domain-containing protein, partial [Solirubrobacteraceae bacterium]